MPQKADKFLSGRRLTGKTHFDTVDLYGEMIVQLIATISYQHGVSIFYKNCYTYFIALIILYKTVDYVLGLNFAYYFIKNDFVR